MDGFLKQQYYILLLLKIVSISQGKSALQQLFNQPNSKCLSHSNTSF